MGQRPYAYIVYGYRMGSHEIGWFAPRLEQWFEEDFDIAEHFQDKLAASNVAGVLVSPGYAIHADYYLAVKSHYTDWDSPGIISASFFDVSPAEKEMLQRAVDVLDLEFREPPNWYLFSDLR